VDEDGDGPTDGGRAAASDSYSMAVGRLLQKMRQLVAVTAQFHTAMQHAYRPIYVFIHQEFDR